MKYEFHFGDSIFFVEYFIYIVLLIIFLKLELRRNRSISNFQWQARRESFVTIENWYSSFSRFMKTACTAQNICIQARCFICDSKKAMFLLSSHVSRFVTLFLVPSETRYAYTSNIHAHLTSLSDSVMMMYYLETGRASSILDSR